ncbi:tetraacyldisaccharide 4'-kinase [bacterium]|nr:tetraacyldisaccharide 4'-kinase [bacterium]
MIRIWKSAFWGYILWPLSILYRAGWILRNQLYRWGILSSIRLDTKVIGVGNVTVGGTGKTPCVERMSHLLRERGCRIVVLSRGFRRKRRGSVVVSDGEKINVNYRQAGDEPMLLAKSLSGIPVIVGKNRAKTGRLAVKNWKIDVLLLDDAFQNKQLKKDLDLVVMDSTNLWGNGRLLPAGPLREPLKGLKRADAILLSRVNEQRVSEKDARRIQELSGAKIFSAIHKPVHFVSIQDKKKYELDTLRNKKGIAFAGIGNPDSFQKTLRSVGMVLIDFLVFRDHHGYQPADLKKIIQRAESQKAEVLVTTEKDHVRLPPYWNPPIPAYVLKIAFEIQKGFQELNQLLDSVLTPQKEGGI